MEKPDKLKNNIICSFVQKKEKAENFKKRILFVDRAYRMQLEKDNSE